MKIILTESQVRKILITEGEELAHRFLRKADDIKEDVNRGYSKLSFSVLAELMEGNNELGAMRNKFDAQRVSLKTHGDKAMEYFEKTSQTNMLNSGGGTSLYGKVSETYTEILDDKLDSLIYLIDRLIDIRDANIEEKFKDIKRMDV
jgi:hypothetical protein